MHSPKDGSITEAPLALIKVLQKMKPNYEVSSFASDSVRSTKTTKLFESILLGFGDKGGRNNALAEFVGGLLLRGVDPEITYHLAKMANNNTQEPLGNKEFERTFKSMLDKEIRRIGLDND